MRKISLLPSTGVPVGALIVSVAACAVHAYSSYALMSGVTAEAEDVVTDTRGLLRPYHVPFVYVPAHESVLVDQETFEGAW